MPKTAKLTMQLDTMNVGYIQSINVNRVPAKTQDIMPQTI